VKFLLALLKSYYYFSQIQCEIFAASHDEKMSFWKNLVSNQPILDCNKMPPA